MDKIQEQVQEQPGYTSMYELTAVRPVKEDKRDEQRYSDTVCSTRGGLQSDVPPPELPVVQVSGRKSLADTRSTNDLHHKSSSWSKPLLFITVLLCLILILLIIILGIVVYDKYATGNNVECTNTATGASNSSNTNEWADRIAQNISQKIPDFTEWANDVSQNTLQLFQNNTNFTELDKQILQTTRGSAQKLINIVNTLSNLQDTSTSTAGVVDDILLIAQELLVLHNDSTPLPTSCKEIKERQPLSPSGYYILVALNGGAYETYCNMGELCGSGGGLTRLAYLDMSDATHAELSFWVWAIPVRRS